ncbi:amino acid adenylation domain-containing protein [Dietzia sp. B44]|uniref:amino acid adenylation domain-containing protein n=1 Tax=Dietzia sp. B44 TaxID=1630633 RepID=UPI0015FB7296|nr:amino acid adenylation domain-containing protein [Dietzia sp. B44]MBB1054469.1 amino acid adenylation domain-containing protein [Dietzia sp. B44]
MPSNRSVVAAAVCDILEVDSVGPGKLVDLGLDSLSAVRLQRLLVERTGVRVPLRDFVGDIDLESLERRCAAAEMSPGRSTERSAAVSPAGEGGVDDGGESSTDGADRESVPGTFALSPVQSTYWVGRGDDYPLGGVSTYFYSEYEIAPPPGTDALSTVRELESAWNRVVARHPMLRAVVGRDGAGRILDDPGVHRFEIVDLRSDPDPQAGEEGARQDLSHRRAPAHRWPVHTLAAVLRPDGSLVQCVGFDVLLIDFPSIRRVLDEWGSEYRHQRGGEAAPGNGVVPPPALRRSEVAERAAMEFWRGRAQDLPGGPWDTAHLRAEQITPPRFRRSEGRVDHDVWEDFRAAARAHGVSPAGALASLFSLALRRFGARDRFCLVTTLFNPEAREEPGVGDTTRIALLDTDRVDSAEGFADYAVRVTRNFWDAVDHSAVPASRVVGEVLGPSTGIPEHPVVFTTSIGDRAGARTDAWLGRRGFGVSQTPQVLLDAIHWEEDDELVLAWDHVIGAVDESVVDGMRHAVQAAVAVLARDEAAWTRPGLFLDPWVRTPRPRPVSYSSGPGLHEPVLAALDEDGGRRVVSQGDRVADADELASIAAWTRGELASRGVSPEEPILVQLGKSVEQIGIVLGITSAGAAYVPVDPAWPLTRVERIAARAGARFAFAAEGTTLPDGVTAIPAVVPRQADGAVRPDPASVEATGLAYTIFTSGSTGEPKGVAIEHGQARTTIDDLARRFEPGPTDVVLGLSALSFDLSVWDIFGGLSAGARLVLPDRGAEADPEHWLSTIETEGVTVWNSAPALAEMLADYAESDRERARTALGSLRLVMMSGDWIPVTLPDRLRDLAPHAVVVSLGGATEASIWSIHHVIGDVHPQWPSVPYGTALDGQWFRVLDGPDGEPVPVGVAGELFIGGAGVARGYLGDEEQTAERFRVHPVYDERLYRTGDEGMWLPDGTIRFLGRVDRQVKVNGYRVELGEIDAALTRLDGVRAGVCSAVDGPGGGKRLVGHVALTPQSGLDQRAIRAALRDALPAYMVPTAVIIHRELPVTANGKIDHKALPDPFSSASSAPVLSASAWSAPVLSTPAPPGPALSPPAAPDLVESENTRDEEPDSVRERPQVHATGIAGLVPELAALLPDDVDPALEPLAAGLDSLAVVRIANLVEDLTGSRPDLEELLATPLGGILRDDADLEPGDRPAQVAAGVPAPAAAAPADPVSLSPAAQVPHESGADLLDVARAGSGVEVTISAGEGPLGSQLLAAGRWLSRIEQSAPEGGLKLDATAGGQDQLVTLRLGRRSTSSSAPATRPSGPAMSSVATTSPSRVVDASGTVEPVTAEPTRAAVTSAPLTEMQVAYLVGRADPWLGRPVAPRYRTEVEVDDLDVVALERALDAVVDAHPMLSARVDDNGRQVIDNSARPRLQIEDLGAATVAEVRTERERRRAEEMSWIHDPQSGRPWLELRAVRLPAPASAVSRWMVVLILDMLFCDVRGAEIIARDLTAAYRGSPVTRPPVDFLSWADARAGVAAGASSSRPVGTATVGSAQVGTPRPPVLLPVRPPGSSGFTRRRRQIDPRTTTELIRRCAVHRTTLDAVLVTAFGALLATDDGDRPPVVVTVLDRPAEHRDVVGEYTSTVVVDPPDGRSTSERARAAATRLLEGVRDLGRDGSGHGNVRIREHLRSGGGTGVLPVVYSSGLTGWTGGPAACDALAELGQPVHSISSTPQVLIDLQSFRDTDGSLLLVLDAVEDAFLGGVLDGIADVLAATVTALADGDDRWHESGFPSTATPGVPRRDAAGLGRTRSATIPGRLASEDDGGGVLSLVRETVAELLGRTPGHDELDRGFFELGMTSMDLVRLRRTLGDRGHRVELAELFAHPDIRSLAAGLQAAPIREPDTNPSPNSSSHPDPDRAGPATDPDAHDPLAQARQRGRQRRRIRQETLS